MTIDGPAKLRCRDLVELVTSYLEGTLTRAQQGAVRAHLEDCAECTEYVEQMRTTVGMLGRLHDDDLPAELVSRLRETFRSAG